jgi:hypothetical protein
VCERVGWSVVEWSDGTGLMMGMVDADAVEH